MLAMLFSPIGRLLAAVGAVLAAILTIYAKGRSDAAGKIEAKSLRETQDAIDKAIHARRDAARSGGLYDNDGFKRD
jgi:hypothetical protein